MTPIDLKSWGGLAPAAKYVLLDDTHAAVLGTKRLVRVTSPFVLLQWARSGP